MQITEIASVAPPPGLVIVIADPEVLTILIVAAVPVVVVPVQA